MSQFKRFISCGVCIGTILAAIYGSSILLHQGDMFKAILKTCNEDLQFIKEKSVEMTSTLKPKTTQSIGSGPPDELEFPRLYEIPPCSPKKNKTVPVNVCKNLGAKIAERDRQTYLRLFKFFDEQATARNWTWFMAFGTLLGSWRHHDVVPWDADMDIMVEYKHRMDIVNTIEKQERFVPKQCTHHKIRIHDKDNTRNSYMAKDVGRWYVPSIDIFFFSRSATHIYRSDYPTYKNYIFKLSDVFPLHKRPLATMMLPAPKNTVGHLTMYYGFADVCKYYEAKCKDFEPYLPFAHRKWENGSMVESLTLNGKVLQVKRLQEMKENLPLNPYTLEGKESGKKT